MAMPRMLTTTEIRMLQAQLIAATRRTSLTGEEKTR